MYYYIYRVFYNINTLKYSDKTVNYFRGELYEKFIE